MEKAVAAERKYPLHFTELDELYEQAGVPLEKRIPWFDRNATVVAQRDDAQNRVIALEVATGAYDEAIQMMTGRRFAVAEGANLNISEHWTDGHILRRRNRYRRQMSKCTRDSARRPPAHSQGKGSIADRSRVACRFRPPPSALVRAEPSGAATPVPIPVSAG
jgi:hypothetical protein